MTRLADPSPPPAASRASRATFTYAAMLLFTLVTTFTGLFFAPWVIEWLGEERYGATRVLFEYAAYLSLLDLGLGGALLPLLSRALAGRDARALQDVMAAGLRLYAIVTAVVLVVGFSALPWLPRLIRVQPSLHGDLRWAWTLTILSYLCLALAPFRALMESEQRGYISNGLMSLQALGVAFLSLLFAALGLGIAGQSLAVGLAVVLMSLALAAITLRRHPDCLRGLRRPPDPEASAALRGLSGPTLMVNVAGRVSLLSDNLIAGLVLGGGGGGEGGGSSAAGLAIS
jgi:Na+-driven multidrug efflux pump